LPLQTHLLQEGSIGFLLDDPGKGPLVVADNADPIDGYVIHEPLPLHQSQRVIDWNLLVYPDDGGLDQGMVLTKLSALSQNSAADTVRAAKARSRAAARGMARKPLRTSLLFIARLLAPQGFMRSTEKCSTIIMVIIPPGKML